MKGMSFDVLVDLAKSIKYATAYRKEVDNLVGSITRLQNVTEKAGGSAVGSSADVINTLNRHSVSSIAEAYKRHPGLVGKISANNPKFGKVADYAKRASEGTTKEGAFSGLGAYVEGMKDPDTKEYFEAQAKKLGFFSRAFLNFQSRRKEKTGKFFGESMGGSGGGGGTPPTMTSLVAEEKQVKKLAHSYSYLGDLGATAHEKVADKANELLRTIKHLVLAYVGWEAIKRTVEHSFHEMKGAEEFATRNQIAFGSMKNAMDGLEHFREQNAHGKSPFMAEDMMGGIKTLAEKGVDATKNLDMLQNMAAKAGVSFSELGSDMSAAYAGSASGLEKYGLGANEIAAFQQYAQHIPANSKMMISAVNSLIAKHKNLWKDGMKDSINTIQGAQNQMKSTWDMFKEKIFGRPDDPNGLLAAVRGTFSKIADFLSKNGEKIAAIGSAIGKVVKHVWGWIEEFGKKVAHSMFGNFKTTEEFIEALNNKVRRFVLFIEMIKNKVVSFISTLWDVAKPFLKAFVSNPVAVTTEVLLLKLAGGFASSGNPYLALACLIAAGAVDLNRVISDNPTFKGVLDAKKSGNPNVEMAYGLNGNKGRAGFKLDNPLNSILLDNTPDYAKQHFKDIRDKVYASPEAAVQDSSLYARNMESLMLQTDEGKGIRDKFKGNNYNGFTTPNSGPVTNNYYVTTPTTDPKGHAKAIETARSGASSSHGRTNQVH